MKIGVAIPTLNAEHDLPKLLPIVCGEADVSEILVVDSSSNDRTCEIAEQYDCVRTITIERRDFNHGATRELARKELGTDIVVFLTQDIIPVPGFIQPLVQPIIQGHAAVTYARQLPHEGADIFEAFPRTYNYPDQSQRRTIEDAKKFGVFTFFCSDSCSAYSNSAVDSIGGIAPILTNEDYFTVARLLGHGMAISYTADSVVHHSHRYTLRQEFERYFDTGYVRGENPWVNELVGQAEGHGVGFAKAFLSHVARTSPWSIPEAILQTATKWIGYRIGYCGIAFSPRLCRTLSSQKYYWNSSYYTRD